MSDAIATPLPVTHTAPDESEGSQLRADSSPASAPPRMAERLPASVPDASHGDRLAPSIAPTASDHGDSQLPSAGNPIGPELPADKPRSNRPRLEPPRQCSCAPSGRNLIVCIDGTSNKFSKKNTNVVELYNRLIKDPRKQLTYYNSGIGTYAQPLLRSASFIGRVQRVIGYQLDLAFAWRFEKILLNAYLWLTENYQNGDRIFLFGFSRGAYQVRVLSAMIDRVGLLHKGNQDQIPFAYELYAESGQVLEEAAARRAAEEAADPTIAAHDTLDDSPAESGGGTEPKSHPAKLAENAPVSSPLAPTSSLPTPASSPSAPAALQSAPALSPSAGSAPPIGDAATRPAVSTAPEAADSASPAAANAKPLSSSAIKQKVQKDTEKDAKTMLQRFKDAFSREVQVHFVGVWDTVSSVGIVRDKSLPGTTRGMGHVCYFRHALALHERRVKFQPEFACGSLGPDSQYTKEAPATSDEDAAAQASTGNKDSRPNMAHTKEVWFAGSHSQIGGGDVNNMNLNKFGPALRWVAFEAELAGLRLKQDPESWEVTDLTIHNSLKRSWLALEILPLSRLRYDLNQTAIAVASPTHEGGQSLLQRILLRKRTTIGFDKTTKQPNLGRPRRVQLGQLIHETAFDYQTTSTGRPATDWMATLPSTWERDVDLPSMRSGLGEALGAAADQLQARNPMTLEELKKSLFNNYVEFDAYTAARHVLQKIWAGRHSLPKSDERSRLQKLSSTEPGRRALLDCLKEEPSAEIILTYILNLCIGRATPPEIPLSADLVQSCTCALRALLVVKPDLETNTSPGDTAQAQLEAAELEGLTDVERNLCKFSNHAGMQMTPIRKLAAAVAATDKKMAKSFIRALGSPAIVRLSRPENSSEYYLSLAAVPNSKWMFLGTDEGTIRICDFDRGLISPFILDLDAAVWAIGVSPDAKYIAAGLSDGTIRWFNAETGAALEPPIMAHRSDVRCITFSEKASLLASSSDDGDVRLWDIATRTQKGSPIQHTDWVRSVAFSPNGEILAAACDDRAVHLWDVQTFTLVGRLADHRGYATSVAFSPNGQYLASGSTDHSVRLWKLPGSRLGPTQPFFDSSAVRVLEGHSGRIRSIAFSHDSKLLCSSSEDGTARVWEVPTGALQGTLRGHNSSAVYSVLYSYDIEGPSRKARIATCSLGGTVIRWDGTDEWIYWDSDEARRWASQPASTTVSPRRPALEVAPAHQTLSPSSSSPSPTSHQTDLSPALWAPPHTDIFEPASAMITSSPNV